MDAKNKLTYIYMDMSVVRQSLTFIVLNGNLIIVFWLEI